MNKEIIEITENKLEEIIEEYDTNYITIMNCIDSVGDHEEVYHKFIICRIKDKKYFKFEYCRSQHIYDNTTLNNFPLKATQVFPKEITTIVYE